jgi:hypothetical protein
MMQNQYPMIRLPNGMTVTQNELPRKAIANSRNAYVYLTPICQLKGHEIWEILAIHFLPSLALWPGVVRTDIIFNSPQDPSPGKNSSVLVAWNATRTFER